MTEPTLVTDIEKLEARKKFQQEQILGGKSQATFADMGICTPYQLVFDLGDDMSYQGAEAVNAKVATCIEQWLQTQITLWVEKDAGDDHARRLPVGELSVARRKKMHLRKEGDSPPKPIFVIEYEGSLPATHIDQNVLDQSVYIDLCALYVAIVCECGFFPALIVVGNHHWQATMNGNDATFTKPQEPQGNFTVTSSQEPSTL